MASDFVRRGFLNELAEMGYDEIAQEMGLTKDQVYYAEKTGLAKLRKKLVKYEEDIRDARQSERHGRNQGCYSHTEDWHPGGLRDMQANGWS